MLFGPFRYNICVNLPAKMLLKINTVWAFIVIVSIPDENNFPERPSDAPLHCQNFKVFRWFGNLHLRQCIALFAVMEGWLLLDIR